jgi:tetratricopeptide (TPR) repeat protein
VTGVQTCALPIWRLWGRGPLGYHLVNVALHALGAVLFFLLLRHLEVPGAWVAAAIFALHPLHVESVAWITERKNVLSLPLGLGAALAYLGFALPRGDAAGGRWGRRYALALALFVAALLAKSVTATLPAAILVALWWKRGRVGWRDLLPLLPFFAAGAGLGLHTAWLEKHHVGAHGPDWDLSVVEHALVAGRALWFYAAKLLWPRPLTFFYPRWQVDAGKLWWYAFAFGALGAAALLWRARGRWGRGPLAAAAVYAIALGPVSGFFNVYPMRFSFVADHFAYHASLAPIALAGAGLAALGRWLAPRPGAAVRAGSVAVLLAALGALTWSRCGAFRDEETLWRDTLAKNPAAFLAQNNLGVLLAARGERAAARERYAAAMRLKPDWAEPYYNLGVVLDEDGDVAGAEAQYQRDRKSVV